MGVYFNQVFMSQIQGFYALVAFKCSLCGHMTCQNTGLNEDVSLKCMKIVLGK